jgi:hypothetical protein
VFKWFTAKQSCNIKWDSFVKDISSQTLITQL